MLEVAADLGAELHGVASHALLDEALARAKRHGAVIDDEQVSAAQRELTAMGLLFPADDTLRLVPAAMTALPATFSVLPARPVSEVAVAVEALSTPERRMLLSLATSGGVGHSRDAAPDADPSRPIPSLISAGLLERIDSSHVRLPRPVARVVRGEHTHDLPLSAPQLSSSPVGEKTITRVDAAGAAQGLEFTRRVAVLVDTLSETPIALNKDRTVPTRAAATLARALGTTTSEVKLLVGVAASAGLVTTGLTANVPEPLDPEANYLAPTRDVDDWLAADLSQRWARILTAWLANPHAHFREGRLLDDSTRSDQLPELRRILAEQYTRLPDGVALTDSEVVARLTFHAPLVAAHVPDAEVHALVVEARSVGALAHDTATTVLRELLAGRDITHAAAEHTPGEVEQFIVQADMTVMVPGPLPARMQATLDLIADVEAPGLAAVYRITERSLRRGLDSGLGAPAITEWLAAHALGEVPQTVSYLVADTARQHGGLRGGTATSYLRCDDDTMLAEVMASPAAQEARLLRIAATVVVSELPLARVVHVLRNHGFSPVAESNTGDTIDIRPEPARAYGAPRQAELPIHAVDESRIDAAVAAVRGQASTSRRLAEPAQETSGESVVATLQAAARGGRTVVVKAVDKSGRALQATVKPLTVTGGQVDAIDESTGRVHRFLLHRITNVHLK